MNRRQTAAVVFVGLVAVPLAIAQSAPPAASPSPSAATTFDEAAQASAPAKRDSGGDARLCLEFPTNLQIIACAEKYRTHKRNR